MVALKNFTDFLRRKEILERNPEFPSIDVPEPKKIWTKKAQALKALPFVPEHDRAIIHFMLHHPLRSGEVCMLRVRDFNIEDGYIHVHRALSLGEERHRKNKKGYLCALSEKFDNSILKRKFPDSYVFLNAIGNHYNSNSLRKIWERACRKAGIEYIPLKYSGRTTIATEAINAGVPIEHVAGALGDSIEVTKKHYAHLNVNATRRVIDN
jgi:integrase